MAIHRISCRSPILCQSLIICACPLRRVVASSADTAGKETLPWLDCPEYADMNWGPDAWPQTPSGVIISDPSPVGSWSSQITSIVKDYLLRKVCLSTLTPDRPEWMWFSSQPPRTSPDEFVTNVFLNIFRRHIPPVFSLFQEMDLSGPANSSYYMAMAAVGGLFCSTQGSYDVARSLYNDSRRILLTRVCDLSAICLRQTGF